MLDGLRVAGRAGVPVVSVGIDGRAVDYGLLDADGELLGNPVHYRDARTDACVGAVLDRVPAGELYGLTGIRLMSINTVCQLVAAAGSAQRAAARRLLLVSY